MCVKHVAPALLGVGAVSLCPEEHGKWPIEAWGGVCSHKFGLQGHNLAAPPGFKPTPCTCVLSSESLREGRHEGAFEIGWPEPLSGPSFLHIKHVDFPFYLFSTFLP